MTKKAFNFLSLFAIGFLIVLRANGSAIAYLFACLFLVVAILGEVSIQRPLKSSVCVFAFVLWGLYPSSFLLWGVLALVAFCHQKTLPLSILFLVCFVLDDLGITIWYTSFFILVVLITIATVIYFEHTQKIIIGLGALCIGLTLISVFSSKPIYRLENFTKLPEENIHNPTSVFCRVANIATTNEKKSKHSIIRSPMFDSKITDEQKGFIIFENRKAYPFKNNIINQDRWQQPTSWHDNLLIGNQYYLEALRKDGGLYSNIGSGLKDTGNVLLSYTDGRHKQPLIVQVGNKIYAHDSDYYSSFIANYQQNFLTELFYSSWRPIAIRGINIFCVLIVLLSVFVRESKKDFLFALGLLTVLISYLFISHFPKNGEIRMVGEITNSHEREGFDAIPKKLVEAGYKYVIGNRNCKILCVQSKKSAKVENEILVLAEPLSKIEIGNEVYQVDETPQGFYRNVVDARFWVRNGTLIQSPIIRIGKTILLASGSPAIQQWTKYIK